MPNFKSSLIRSSDAEADHFHFHFLIKLLTASASASILLAISGDLPIQYGYQFFCLDLKNMISIVDFKIVEFKILHQGTAEVQHSVISSNLKTPEC